MTVEIFKTERDAITAAMKNGGGEHQFNSSSQRDYRYEIVSYKKSDHNVLIAYTTFLTKDVSSHWGRYAVVPMTRPKKPKILYCIDIGRGNDESGLSKYVDQNKFFVDESYWNVNNGGGGKTYIVYGREEYEDYNTLMPLYEEKIREAISSFMEQIRPPVTPVERITAAIRERWYNEDVLIRRQRYWWERLFHLFK